MLQLNLNLSFKKLFVLIAIILLISATLLAEKSVNHNLDPYNPEYVSGEILIKFNDDTEVTVEQKGETVKVGVDKIDALLEKHQVTKMEKVFKNSQKRQRAKFITTPDGETRKVPQLFNIYKLKLSEKADIESIIKDFDKLDIVDYAEPNYLFFTMDTTPDDPYYTGGEQWYIDEVNAPAAWDSTTGDTSQVIGIIDTGVDWDHPDLDAKIWDNTGEIPDNGIDDDSNGFIDDVRGWDFVNNDNDPNDDNCHGTHVAGIAAAETNNATGVAGIAWNARIMPIKMLQSSGTGSSSDLASAIEYASDNGATVINMSLGSYGESMTVKTALENAYTYSVMVAAAGNDHLPLVQEGLPSGNMYPACYKFVIGAEATNQTGARANFSNIDPSGPVEFWNEWGNNYELKAPGVGIYSTFPNGNYNLLSGTSMASPIVAGAVSLMKSYNPTQSTEQLFARLIQSANNGVIDIENSLDLDLIPDLYYIDYTIVDTLPGCDDDGVADAGETVEIYLTVKNAGGSADSVWSKLRFAPYEDTTTANITDSTSYIGDISAYATMTGEQDPFIVEIEPDVANNRDICFECEFVIENQIYLLDELTITIQKGKEFSGYYSGLTHLSTDKYYIIKENTVFDSLMADPGCTIRLNGGKSISITSYFKCNGTADSLIVFTSNKDGTMWSNKWLNIKKVGDFIMNFNYCIFEYANTNASVGKGILVDADTVRNCIFRYNYDTLEGRRDSPTNYYKNVFYYNSAQFIFKWVNGIYEFNIFSKNENTNGAVFETNYVEDLSEVQKNAFYNNKAFDISCLNYNNFIFNLPPNYHGTINQVTIDESIKDYFEDSNLPIIVADSFLVVPPEGTHGIVWKVEINDVLVNKYDNPYNSPSGLGVVGAETLKFDVHFNRAMDTTYTPFLTFGVREPYTQNIVSDSSFWSSDSTVWTAYKTIGLETGDGINRVRVAEARDDEHFEIPKEDSRFEFVIQAAGAQSIEFVATAGIGKVNLEWPPAETDDALGYNLYRYENLTDSTFSDTALINSDLITDTTYTDFEVIPDTTYHYLYKIVGTDMQESDFSKAVTATPFAAADGDANGDQSVNVLDITSVVSYMLDQDPQPFLFDAADVNYDDTINVLDIIGVVNIILGNKPTTYASTEPATIRLKENVLELESSGNIAGLQFELQSNNPENIKLISQLNGFELSTSVKEDKLTGVIYNLSGKTIPKGKQTLINIKTEHKIELADVIAGNSQAKVVKTTIDDGTSLTPDKFLMHQNYPNPFKHSTTIEYALAKPARVEISIYNIKGQLVKTYQVGEQNAGFYDVVWDSRNESGNRVGNGVYFYKLKADINNANSFERIKKVLIIR